MKKSKHNYSGAYLEPACKMKFSMTLVNSLQPLANVRKSFILNVEGS